MSYELNSDARRRDSSSLLLLLYHPWLLIIRSTIDRGQIRELKLKYMCGDSCSCCCVILMIWTVQTWNEIQIFLSSFSCSRFCHSQWGQSTMSTRLSRATTLHGMNWCVFLYEKSKPSISTRSTREWERRMKWNGIYVISLNVKCKRKLFWQSAAFRSAHTGKSEEKQRWINLN